MGHVYADIKISNPLNSKLEPVGVSALVDTGAATLCIPEHIQLQLDLQEEEKREVTIADGSQCLVPYVGPVQIRFANRSCFTGAYVLGNEVLLGVIPIEDMDLIINPLRQEITVNPDSPNVPHGLVK